MISLKRTRVLTGGLAVLAAVALYVGPAGAEGLTDEAIQGLEQQIEALRQEVEALKQDRARDVARQQEEAAAAARIAAENEITRTASVDAGQDRDHERQSLLPDLGGVELGGYGSVRFEQNSADDTNNTFDFRRFVLTVDAPVAPSIRAGLELEFERFRKLELERSSEYVDGGLKVEQEVEGTNESEITLEQAWVQYDFDDAFRLRAGGVLIPLGRFNINHDDDRYDIARRPLVDRGAPALPAKAAWAELGVGFNGDMPLGEQGELSYEAYVVNGATLEPEVEEVIQTRDPKRNKLELEAKFKVQSGTFGTDVKDAKAVTGRLALSPALGHEIAGSFYYGRYTPDYLPDESIASFAVDGITSWGPFELEGEYVYSDFGDIDNVASGFAAVAKDRASATPKEASPEFESEIELEIDGLAEKRHGYWLEATYDTRPRWLTESMLGRRFADPALTLVARGEQVWIDGLMSGLDFSDGEVTNLDQSDHRIDRVTIGTAYRPVPNAAFQLAYEFTQVDEGSLSAVTNYLATPDDNAHAVLLGTVFGF